MPPAATFPADAATITLATIVMHRDTAAGIARVRSTAHRCRSRSWAVSLTVTLAIPWTRTSSRRTPLLRHRRWKTSLRGNGSPGWRCARLCCLRLACHRTALPGPLNVRLAARLTTLPWSLAHDTGRTPLGRMSGARTGLILGLSANLGGQRDDAQDRHRRQPKSGLVEQRHSHLPLDRPPYALVAALVGGAMRTDGPVARRLRREGFRDIIVCATNW